MADEKSLVETPKRWSTHELELPETTFVRDIENRVFQAIVLQSLSKVEGISLLEGNFIDSIFGRASVEGIRGIHAEQDHKEHTISVKVEVNICYGIPIPSKADEIQTLIAEEITHLTGLHVSRVHVVFKNVILKDPHKCHICTEPPEEAKQPPKEPVLLTDQLDGDGMEQF